LSSMGENLGRLAGHRGTRFSAVDMGVRLGTMFEKSLGISCVEFSDDIVRFVEQVF
jgi:hypothetical protein